MAKGLLVIDMPERCWDCPCCDNEQCYCTILENYPSCDEPGRLENCTLKEITITPEEFTKRMQDIYDEEVGERDDGQVAKERMLELMCDVLCNFGYEAGIDIFRETPWY